MSSDSENTCAAIIVAAGRGTRAGGELPKQWQMLGGRRVIDRALDAFLDAPGVGPVVAVLHPDDMGRLNREDVIAAKGGNTRAASVLAGLEALHGLGVDRVLIHDAARATVPAETIAAVLALLETHDAAAPGLGVVDALWAADAAGNVAGARDRLGLYRAQTPQGFRYAAILAAHRAHPGDSADDVEVARAAGIEVAIAPGHPDNIKITSRDDFARAERLLKGDRMDIRLGNGYDVHRFGPGGRVTLCGVTLPHDRGLQGHSDADVGMHAVTDAIYGALAEGDIGRHFPPSDPQWKGAASDIFLRHAAELAAARGYTIGNVDCTLVCETPKIAPHAAAMQARLAGIMEIEPDRVSVKATTSERLGFTGRGEGIAAIATAALVRA